MTGLPDAFRRLYLESGVWMRTRWLGTQVVKCPLDLWVYQEILFRTRPDAVVETGTWHGGSALFLASMFDLLERGRVVTIDIEAQAERQAHPRITYLTGSSVDPEVVAQVRREVSGADGVMVILDSDHSKQHVLAELRAYGPLVSEGCYLIVEDTAAATILAPDSGPGPGEAIEEFLAENPSFVVDAECEKFLMTWHPGGYLRRKSTA